MPDPNDLVTRLAAVEARCADLENKASSGGGDARITALVNRIFGKWFANEVAEYDAEIAKAKDATGGKAA